RGLDQVRDQVIAPLQLHIDLREGVLESVARSDQPVVERDDPEHHDEDDRQQDPEPNHDESPWYAPLARVKYGWGTRAMQGRAPDSRRPPGVDYVRPR